MSSCDQYNVMVEVGKTSSPAEAKTVINDVLGHGHIEMIDRCMTWVWDSPQVKIWSPEFFEGDMFQSDLAHEEMTTRLWNEISKHGVAG